MRLLPAALLASIASFCAFGQDYVITTVAGNGTAGFTGDDGPKTPRQASRFVIPEKIVGSQPNMQGAAETLRSLDSNRSQAPDAGKARAVLRTSIVSPQCRYTQNPWPRVICGAWSKLKFNLDQELVIGGYIPGRRGFDALLVGYYEKGRLIFSGKVRNGFKDAGSKEKVFARFKGLGTATCPFENLPEPANARRGMALTAEAMKLCCWLKPSLVAQIGIREWTADGHLRHSTFVGLKRDEDPREVVREDAER